MSITLEQLADEIRTALQQDDTPDGRRRICGFVSAALKDDAFVAQHLTERESGAHPREVLYEDPDLGFCICGHVYDGPAHGTPHDHGTSWAIYGQAAGTTEMTDWRIVQKGTESAPILVEPERTYTLEPGDAHYYDVADVHSPKRDQPVKLLRIEGRNLDRVQRSNIQAR
ncbi:MAG: hypothetical protein AAGL24_07645 [Pseudomonadota bacterium]